MIFTENPYNTGLALRADNTLTGECVSIPVKSTYTKGHTCIRLWHDSCALMFLDVSKKYLKMNLENIKFGLRNYS